MREYLKTNQSNALKSMLKAKLRNFAFNMTQKMKSGMIFDISIYGRVSLAVTISATSKEETTGEIAYYIAILKIE